MQTYLVPKIMHQNLAIILRQFNYSKNSFIVLVPGPFGRVVRISVGPYIIFLSFFFPPCFVFLFTIFGSC